jgi:hypothetical protein
VAITGLPLQMENELLRFVSGTLRDVAIEPIPLEGFAAWVAKLKPLLDS